MEVEMKEEEKYKPDKKKKLLIFPSFCISKRREYENPSKGCQTLLKI